MPRLFLILILFFFSSPLNAQESESSRSLFSVKPIVSLIISAEDPRHVLESIDSAQRLSRSVKVRNVVLVTSGDKALSFSSQTPDAVNQNAVKKPPDMVVGSQYLAALDKLGLMSSKVSFDANIISRLKLSYSPTWIVRHEGKDYVFEGYSDISKYFTREGVFNY